MPFNHFEDLLLKETLSIIRVACQLDVHRIAFILILSTWQALWLLFNEILCHFVCCSRFISNLVLMPLHLFSSLARSLASIKAIERRSWGIKIHSGLFSIACEVSSQLSC